MSARRDTGRTIILGALLGAAAAGGLAALGTMPGVLAQERQVSDLLAITATEAIKPQLDGDALYKPPRFIVEDWVDMEVSAEQTVRKIGFGRTSFVDVMTTSTGIYSSDGLDSAHIRYPGIHDNPDFEGEPAPRLSIWTSGGWTAVTVRSADSFVYLSSKS